MKVFTVRHALGEYPVAIGHKLEGKLGSWLKKEGLGPRLVLISHPEIMQFHGFGLIDSLSKQGFQVVALNVPQGEDNKSVQEACRLYAEFSRNYIERSTPVLALGGGVIGDLAGFTAATYMRGLNLVHIPTTLLAQVDSSIGGKTAVNYGSLKNQIGVFHAPRAVFSDLSTLNTLPAVEMNNGLAEVLKCAVIGDPRLFVLLERKMEQIKSLDSRLLEEVVFLTALVKARVVSRDEREHGLRRVLNLGHTVGHAVESVSKYTISHGAAVAVGLVASCRLANRLKLLPVKDMDRIIHAISLAGLPTALPDFDLSLALEAMKHDKKIVGGKLHFVLPIRIGRVIVRDVDQANVAEVLSER